jgi:hypothetical protein
MNGITAGDQVPVEVPTRFKVGTNVQGQTMVSNIASLAEEEAKSCLLICCITKVVISLLQVHLAQK